MAMERASEVVAVNETLHLNNTLQAGQKYYIKAMVKEGGGGDYLQVGYTTGTQEITPLADESFM